jgi:glycine/D-amino acid oxidase-like deaminating enzyme
MELTSDFPFWSVRNGLPANYPSLRQDLRCDAVVVGGGITGALAAFYLTEAGVDTVVLDKRDIGTGSTSGSTALLQYEVDVPLRELAQRVGLDHANRAYGACYQAVFKIEALVKKLRIDCEFERKPSLFLARSANEQKDFHEELSLRKKLGFAVEYWSQSDIARHYPFSRPAALFSENAAQVDPHLLTHGLLRAGERHGLKVFDRTGVKHFKPDRRGMTLTTEDGFTVRARRAVMATGFESMKYVKGEAGRLRSTYALISEPLAVLRKWYRRSLIWESGQPYLYLRTTAENRVIVGGEDVDLVDPKRRDKLIPQKTRTLTEKFKKLFPSVPLDVAYKWAGTFGETKDGLAYIGENPGLRHAYFALGYGGNGITYGLIAAELIRDAFLGRRNRDAELFGFGR